MRFIKHKYWKDIAFDITQKRTYGPYTILTGYYWNQGFNESYLIYPTTKKIKVLTTEMNANWMICNEPFATCIRKVQWRSYGNNNL